MTTTTFNVNHAKNLNAALAEQWINAMEPLDLDIDREYYALFIADDIVRGVCGLDTYDIVTDYDRTACADMLTLTSMMDIMDLDTFGAALLDNPYTIWDETETGLQLVA